MFLPMVLQCAGMVHFKYRKCALHRKTKASEPL